MLLWWTASSDGEKELLRLSVCPARACSAVVCAVRMTLPWLGEARVLLCVADWILDSGFWKRLRRGGGSKGSMLAGLSTVVSEDLKKKMLKQGRSVYVGL